MEKLARREAREGISRSALRLWGLLFAGLGLAGRAILQNGLLDMGNITNDQLLEAMMSSSQTMVYATLALVLQAVEACAIPIFAFLLVEGVQNTSNLDKYLVRVVGLAFLCEIPYNLAMTGAFWDTSSRNPVFGLAFGMGMLYLFRLYGGHLQTAAAGGNHGCGSAVAHDAADSGRCLLRDHGGGVLAVPGQEAVPDLCRLCCRCHLLAVVHLLSGHPHGIHGHPLLPG